MARAEAGGESGPLPMYDETSVQSASQTLSQHLCSPAAPIFTSHGQICPNFSNFHILFAMSSLESYIYISFQ